MQTKTAIRKAVGRGKFTSIDFAEAADVSRPVARRRLNGLVESGVITLLDETEKVTDEDGNALRGKPRNVYKVAAGK